MTIPSIIFNAVFNKNLSLISSPSLQAQSKDGAAYSFASQAHHIRGTLAQSLWAEVMQAYTTSLRTIWWIGFGISVVSLFALAAERGLELRKESETEYGLKMRRMTFRQGGD